MLIRDATASIQSGKVLVIQTQPRRPGTSLPVSNNGTVKTTAALSLNFTGDGVTVTDDGNGNETIDVSPPTPPDSATFAAEFAFDGGGSPIANGLQRYLYFPFACEIEEQTLVSDQPCTAEADIWTSTKGAWNPPTAPTSGNSICAAAKPTITAGTIDDDSALTGWTTAVDAGTLLVANIDSNDNATLITLALTMRRT